MYSFFLLFIALYYIDNIQFKNTTTLYEYDILKKLENDNSIHKKLQIIYYHDIVNNIILNNRFIR